MYTLLYEGHIKLFDTLDDALTFAKNLSVGYTILDPDNKKVWDSMDRVGP